VTAYAREDVRWFVSASDFSCGGAPGFLRPADAWWCRLSRRAVRGERQRASPLLWPLGASTWYTHACQDRASFPVNPR